MKKLIYNIRTKSFSKCFATKVLTEEEVTGVSLRRLMGCEEGIEYLSTLPKLGRILTALKNSLISDWPFIYAVNYKISDNLLKKAKYVNSGDDLIVDYSGLTGYKTPNAIKDKLLTTQGIHIETYGSRFDSSKLKEYGIPEIKGTVYIDLNPLTEKEGTGGVELPEFYKTNISFHSDTFNKSKITLKVPYMISL